MTYVSVYLSDEPVSNATLCSHAIYTSGIHRHETYVVVERIPNEEALINKLTGKLMVTLEDYNRLCYYYRIDELATMMHSRYPFYLSNTSVDVDDALDVVVMGCIND